MYASAPVDMPEALLKNSGAFGEQADDVAGRAPRGKQLFEGGFA